MQKSLVVLSILVLFVSNIFAQDKEKQLLTLGYTNGSSLYLTDFSFKISKYPLGVDGYNIVNIICKATWFV